MGIVDRLRRAAGGLISEWAALGADGAVVLGPQVCGSLDESSAREWLVADGCGGYAMGTVSGLRTRRYHGLLVVSGPTVGTRRLGLAALEPVLVIGDRRHALGTSEWAGGTVDPGGHRLLAAFALDRGVPRWQWRVGGVVVEREIAAVHGRPAVATVFRVVTSPCPVRIELTALCADRDAHGSQTATAAGLQQKPSDGGCIVAGWYRLQGPGFEPVGTWHRGARLREEEARGEGGSVEDLWAAGRFQADLATGESISVVAWADDLHAAPPPGEDVVRSAKARWRTVTASASDETDAFLLAAADQFVLDGNRTPAVVAGYPWFGEWGRDTYLSLDGLLLSTGRTGEARELLRAGAAGMSEGMVANTTDSGEAAHNTVDATLWYLHAVGAYVDRTGDEDLAAELAPLLDDVVQCHLDGTRFGIHVTDDGLLAQGEDGVALTWMDAVTDNCCHTPRTGKPVEVQALWINALGSVRVVNDLIHRDPDRWGLLEEHARSSFATRFAGLHHLADVVDGPAGTDGSLRPNLLLAAALPHGPGAPASSVEACRDELLTPLGLRTLAPDDRAYHGAHRGTRLARDAAYHQGTVWPWLLGPFVDACMATDVACPAVLDGVEAHLGEVGLGSISETADGDAPHGATGCPFQAWSVAEVLRVRRRWIDRLRS